VRAVRAVRAVERRVGVEAAAGDHFDLGQQRRQRAHRGRLGRPALAADEHAADARIDRAGQQRLAQRLLADDRGEGEHRRHVAASSSSPSAAR